MELNPLHLVLAFLFGVWIGGLSGYSFGLKLGTRDTINVLESRVEARLNKISKALDAALAKKEEE